MKMWQMFILISAIDVAPKLSAEVAILGGAFSLFLAVIWYFLERK